jgi:hypothetical protein
MIRAKDAVPRTQSERFCPLYRKKAPFQAIFQRGMDFA